MIPAQLMKWAVSVFALVSLFFGIFTAAWPRHSIGLYVEIMRWFNWRASPINEAHELKTTRILGVILVLLGLAMLILHNP